MKQEEYETRFYEKQARHPDRVNTTNNTTKAPDGNETIADSRDAMEQKKDKVWDKSESTYNSLSATDEKFEQDEHPSDAGESTDDEGSKSKEDYFKKLKERVKKVVEKTPNSKNIQMFNLGNQTPYKLSEGEYYYVDESVVIGGIVIGRTVVFDEGKYAEYNYAGYSVGKSLSPIDHLWVKGYVNNIDKVKDFEGAFLNFAGGVGPFGSSASLGYNKEKQVYIVSASDVAQQLYAGAGLSVQYFSSKTPDWIQGEAPIRWGATTYDWIFNNYYPEEI